MRLEIFSSTGMPMSDYYIKYYVTLLDHYSSELDPLRYIGAGSLIDYVIYFLIDNFNGTYYFIVPRWVNERFL